MTDKHSRDMDVTELLADVKTLPNPERSLLSHNERVLIELAQALAAKLEAAFAPIKLEGEVASDEELDLWRKAAAGAHAIGNSDLPIPRLMARYDQDMARLEKLIWAPVANTVRANLDAALENGYLGSDGTPLDNWTDLEIAQDMVAFSESCQEFSPEQLIPHIAEWRRDHPNH